MTIVVNRTQTLWRDSVLAYSWEEVFLQVAGNVWAHVKISVNAYGIVVDLEA